MIIRRIEMKDRTKLIQQRFYEDNPKLIDNRQVIDDTARTLLESALNGVKILVCGNGESAADSDHIVGELMKGFDLKRPIKQEEAERFESVYKDEGRDIANKIQQTIPAISLNQHAALISAVQNDTDPDMIFAQQVYGYGNEGDVLIGISTSGNAKNVVKAMQVANVKKMITIGLAGKTGGQFKNEAKHAVIAPADETYRVQEFHLAIYHYWCLFIESELFES